MSETIPNQKNSEYHKCYYQAHKEKYHNNKRSYITKHYTKEVSDIVFNLECKDKVNAAKFCKTYLKIKGEDPSLLEQLLNKL